MQTEMSVCKGYTIAHPAIHFYLPRSETSNRPVEFHLGVFWTQKSDFLQKLVFDLQMTYKSNFIGS